MVVGRSVVGSVFGSLVGGEGEGVGCRSVTTSGRLGGGAGGRDGEEGWGEGNID